MFTQKDITKYYGPQDMIVVIKERGSILLAGRTLLRSVKNNALLKSRNSYGKVKKLHTHQWVPEGTQTLRNETYLQLRRSDEGCSATPYAQRVPDFLQSRVLKTPLTKQHLKNRLHRYIKYFPSTLTGNLHLKYTFVKCYLFTITPY